MASSAGTIGVNEGCDDGQYGNEAAGKRRSGDGGGNEPKRVATTKGATVIASMVISKPSSGDERDAEAVAGLLKTSESSFAALIARWYEAIMSVNESVADAAEISRSTICVGTPTIRAMVCRRVSMTFALKSSSGAEAMSSMRTTVSAAVDGDDDGKAVDAAEVDTGAKCGHAGT